MPTAIKQLTSAVPPSPTTDPIDVGAETTRGTGPGFAYEDHGHIIPIAYLTDGVAAPAAVTGKALLYVDNADGDLKVKFSDGHVAVIAADS